MLAIALSLSAVPVGVQARGAGAAAVMADEADSAQAATTPGSQELYLDVSLNEVATGTLARFVLVHRRLHASAATLRGLGLRWTGSATAQGLVALDALPGLQVQYDEARQHLALLAPLDLLGAAQARGGYVTPAPLQADPASRIPGLILNYDVYGQHDDNSSSLGAWNELRLFGLGPGVFVNTGSSRAFRARGARDGHEAVRLDSFWEYDDPERMLTVTVGDTLTGALSWTRPTRIGGIRISRNFALQPYRITTPLASFAGEAVLPSTVDILINGIQQSSQRVQPGQFVIDSAPMLSGAGQAQMVLTDINGQRRVLDFALYGTPQLLEAGLVDWSVELGAMRRSYGQQSFDYADDPVFSATARRGMSDRATLEGHTQLAPGLQLAGVGGGWRVGARGGLLTGAAAGSRHAGHNGTLGSLGYQWNSPAFNLFASSTHRSAGFRDAGSLETGALPRRTDQAFAGFNTRLGQLGASYILQADQDNQARRYATLNWSRQLPRNATVSVSLSRGLDDDAGDSAYLYWSMPLDRHASVSASARHGDRSRGLSMGAHRAPNSDLGGWGWRAQATAGDQPGAQAEVSRLSQNGQWTLGANHWRGDGNTPSATTTYGSASGGLVLVRGHAYAMRRVDDAFAVVDTSGFAGVPVRLENRVVGHTDANGLLLVSRLNAWQANRLSIDPLDLPVDTQLGETSIDAVPQRRSGMLAAFKMKRIHPVDLVLRDHAGSLLPVGSRVWLEPADGEFDADRAPDTVVGHGGMVWLTDLPEGMRLRVQTGDQLCMAAPTLPAGSGAPDEPGDLICR
ncbi:MULTISPECIES: fimbria/pilus outer membrane usher protein [unclassified Luteimonas]|uniref:fimbria/pilus outer membrane usher protein n=1 Tax=unclassified Luteimonas TaxID=2629088 RepID=UPI0016013BFC|nr:fimbria/pilus outer membrane usher protein [Luteimonas sp. MC1825]MBB1472098.1 fimbrial biogenesis outer membrane usher protein [Luteimonas sp. MC1782]MBB6599175.1 fimbrial biogenesis outer membrane usher protein [Luteimonas sp. MC1825]QOC89297.1 fimbrial biogenesis outer membrane usher protein [Luteimonas sp. MC1825]